MRMTSEDAPPRKDGWFQHRGTWEEVTVGTVLEGKKPSERWEVIETAHGAQVRHAYTLWFKVREQTTGATFPIEPKRKNDTVTILTQDPRDKRTAPPTEPSDAAAIMLLVQELGAELLATKDSTTGEITCPDYIYRSHIPGYGERQASRGLREHLRIAHAMSIDDDASHDDMHRVHSQAHNPAWPNIGKGGFPHRHVPENLEMF